MIKSTGYLRKFLTIRCPYCGKNTDYIPCCPSCASDLLKFVNNEHGKTAFCDNFESAFIYEDLVREAITDFKFHDRPEYATSFAEVLKRCVKSYFDVIISVPYYKDDKKEYDTSQLLAKRLSSLLKVPYAKRAAVKIRKTKRQHTLEFDERFHNIVGCFQANPKEVFGKSVLICDDIITSGSTVNELAKACKKAGALRVEAVSMAVTPSAFHVDKKRYL